MSEDEPDESEEAAIDERVTSPMQAFGSREVTIGLLVLLVGLALTFLLPFLF